VATAGDLTPGGQLGLLLKTGCPEKTVDAQVGRPMSDEQPSGSGPNEGAVFRTRHRPMPLPRKSFRQFSRRMDDQLAALVAQWIHTAAPAALRLSRFRRRKRRPR